MPARIIILRHGEKADPFRLCCTGIERSLALRKQYLGKSARQSLFARNEAPVAFLAITLHTIETITPAAASWGLPVTAYSPPTTTKGASDDDLDARTRQAVADVLANPAWRGKTIVMVWEHKRIASNSRKHKVVTLRSGLGLTAARLKVPKNWPDGNYDFFWVIDCDASGKPMRFKMIRQNFTGAFRALPHNGWGNKTRLPAGCD